MQKEFVPYEQALELKELLFDEPCFGYYDNIGKLFFNTNGQPVGNDWVWVVPTDAPTFSQAFRWFREKHNIHISICHSVNGKFDCWTNDGNLLENGKYCEFETYEEAELECLKKLIQIIKNK